MSLPFPDFIREIPLVPRFHVGSVELGPFPIRFYALAYIAGILLGWRYAVSLVKTPRLWGGRPPTLSPPQIDDLILWITLGVIVGGRVGYILFYMLPLADPRQVLANDPWEALRLWHGGMSFHGGAIGVLLAVLGFALANKVNPLRIADIVVAAQPIGQFFGRVANFINGELWGRPTDLPWGMVFCGKNIETYADGSCIAGNVARHPSQLYEAALEGIALFLILRFATHRLGWLQRNGAVTGLFLVGYGAFRILLENVRNPDQGLEHLPLGLTVGILLSIPMVLVGAWLIWRGMKTPLPPPAEVPADEPA